MADQERCGEQTGVCRALRMAPARSRGTGHSGEVRRDVVGAVDGTGEGRWCQEGVVEGTRRGAALGVRRSGQNVGPRGKRLEVSQSTVRRRYSAGGGSWGSGSLRQGSEELVTGWSVTVNGIPCDWDGHV
jgi:hypothetical protein